VLLVTGIGLLVRQVQRYHDALAEHLLYTSTYSWP
jgi:hypothetical protein